MRKLKMMPIDQLTGYEKNPVIHGKAQIEALSKSIREFGCTNPVLVDGNNVVIAGHARLKAALAIDEKKVPVIYLDDLTEAQVRAYRIADNRIAEMAKWDDVALAGEITALAEADYDLDFTGLSVDDIASLIGAVGGKEGEDEVPDRPKKPTTQLGDLYLLGPHRLVCGDATDEAAVLLCLDGSTPNLMVTDPPYGVNLDAEWRSRDGLNKPLERRRILNDDLMDWSAAWSLFPGGVAYAWHAAQFTGPVAASLAASGFEFRAQIVWAKNRFALSRGHYNWQHEPCMYAVRKGKKSGWNGSKRQSTIWDIPIVGNHEFKHPNQKPVECMRRPILNNSKPGDGVYDPFAGVGTTLLAAESEDRICYTIELDPGWCDVIVRRWELQTGKKAERVRSKQRGKKARKKA